jgi:hypothetical protein
MSSRPSLVLNLVLKKTDHRVLAWCPELPAFQVISQDEDNAIREIVKVMEGDLDRLKKDYDVLLNIHHLP